MKVEQRGKLSLVLLAGMACSSILMLSGNSAAASHTATPAAALHSASTMVTELPAVVIIGKRLTAAEKARYRL